MLIASAAPIPGLFNTGVDGDGISSQTTGLSTPTTQSPQPRPALPGPNAVTLPRVSPSARGSRKAQIPAGSHLPPPPANGSDGEWRYQISFDLTGFNETTANITGEWAVDNTGIDILLNGNSTGNSNNNGFGGFTPFTISTGFVAGENTLEFIVEQRSTGTARPGCA